MYCWEYLLIFAGNCNIQSRRLSLSASGPKRPRRKIHKNGISIQVTLIQINFTFSVPSLAQITAYCGFWELHSFKSRFKGRGCLPHNKKQRQNSHNMLSWVWQVMMGNTEGCSSACAWTLTVAHRNHKCDSENLFRRSRLMHFSSATITFLLELWYLWDTSKLSTLQELKL